MKHKPFHRKLEVYACARVCMFAALCRDWHDKEIRMMKIELVDVKTSLHLVNLHKSRHLLID